jgi:putative transposase
MTAADREAAARRQRAQTIALWRWSLIEPAMDPALSSRQRGAIVRQLAGREHAGPSGRTVSVSRKTLDRWITARRADGFDALVPAPRQCTPRTDPQVVELAVGLKRENPARTAAQVRRVLAAQLGWAPSERAIQRWFEARELRARPGGAPPQAYGRFEAVSGQMDAVGCDQVRLGDHVPLRQRTVLEPGDQAQPAVRRDGTDAKRRQQLRGLILGLGLVGFGLFS